jgi:hypothetical protein
MISRTVVKLGEGLAPIRARPLTSTTITSPSTHFSFLACHNSLCTTPRISYPHLGLFSLRNPLCVLIPKARSALCSCQTHPDHHNESTRARRARPLKIRNSTHSTHARGESVIFCEHLQRGRPRTTTCAVLRDGRTNRWPRSTLFVFV